jgi:hypothetical protein
MTTCEPPSRSLCTNRNQFSARALTFAFLEAKAREKGRWTEKVRITLFSELWPPRGFSPFFF